MKDCRSNRKMSESQYNVRNGKKDFSPEKLMLAAGGIFIVLCMIFFLVLHTSRTVVNADENLSEIQYREVEIQSGDSLWSIAKENMNPGFSDIYEYIHEIKTCNNLASDKITSGCYLVVPYYEYR